MRRRDFLRKVSISGASIAVLGSAACSTDKADKAAKTTKAATPAKAKGTKSSDLDCIAEKDLTKWDKNAKKVDFGQCKSVKVKVISELGWYDHQKRMNRFIGAVKKYKGKTDVKPYWQWMAEKNFENENAAGCCTLIDMETMDGKHHKFLLDVGENLKYMDKALKREGVDKMLKNGEIESVVISHEHADHILGLESVLKYNPKLKIIIPEAFYPMGLMFIRGGNFQTPGARNTVLHEGELVKSKTWEVNKLYDGCALVNFDCTIMGPARGEQSLYFNVKDKGIVAVTGCCHQDILNLSQFSVDRFKGGDKLHGVFGGLHMAPMDKLLKGAKEQIEQMGKYKYEKVAVNHCTGLPAVEKMIELGYPVVKGTARFDSKSKLYLGNGDEIVFG